MRTFFKKRFKLNLLFVLFFFTANLLLIISNIPTFIRFSKTPQDRIFPFVHTDWAHDYYLYLSVITQGENGSWLYRDPYTTESTNPGIFYLFFTTIGQTAKIFHLSGVAAYHITTFLGFEFFVILLFLLSSQILGKKLAFWAGIISILGTVSPTLTANLKIDFPINMPWWMAMDAFERLYPLPHYVLSQALLLLAIILFIKFFRTAKLRYALSSGISFGIGGFILPSILIPAFVILPLFLFLHTTYTLFNIRVMLNSFQHLFDNKTLFYRSRNKFGMTFIAKFVHVLKTIKINLNPKLFIGTGIIIAAAFADYLIMKLQVQAGFPWDQWTKWGLMRWNYNEPAFDKTLLLSFGILPLLAIPTIISAVKKKNWEIILIAIWAFLPFILLPFATTLEIAKIRLVQMANFVPFGILVTYTIFKIIPKINSSLLTIDHLRGVHSTPRTVDVSIITFTSEESRFDRDTIRGGFRHKYKTLLHRLKYLFIIIFLLTTLPVSLNILNQRIEYIKTEPIYDHFYIPKTSFDAIKFINKNIPANSVIISNEKYGIIIPAFAPVISYFGHVTQTMNYFDKEKNVTNFFSGIWSEKESKQFLILNKINYVYYGWQEEELGFDISKYTFLKQIYKNEAVEFFQVI